AHAKASEVEIELRAQIERAKKFGIPISHIDTHMGTLMMRRDFVEVFVQLGLEYDLPILWLRNAPAEIQQEYPALRGDLTYLTAALSRQCLPLLDALTTPVRAGEIEQRRQSYLNVVRKAPPGVTQISIHCGFADDELKASANSWAFRDQDRRIFSDPAV